MSFINDVPHYRDYPDGEYYMQTVPDDVWSSMESLIRKAASDSNGLKNVLNTLAEISGGSLTYNWGWEYLVNDIYYCVRDIRKKVTGRRAYRFDAFMDCLAVLHDCGELTYDDINEFLEDHGIGYVCNSSISGTLEWFVVDDYDKSVEPDESVHHKSDKVYSETDSDTNQKTSGLLSDVYDSKRLDTEELKGFLSYCQKDASIADIIESDLANFKRYT